MQYRAPVEVVEGEQLTQALAETGLLASLFQGFCQGGQQLDRLFVGCT